MDNDRLLTAGEVAAILSIKRATVYEAAARGRLPAVHFWKGKRRTLLRFRREDIEHFIRERSVPASVSPRKR